MSVVLRDLLTAVRHGDVALAGESCGYLVLGAADLALQLPRLVHFDSVSLTPEGSVELNAAPCTFFDAERSLRALLGELLRFVRTPCPNLLRVAERTGERGLELLVVELEAALVPVNRRAARRSLSRLTRETLRSVSQVRLHAQVEPVQMREWVGEEMVVASPVSPVSPGVESSQLAHEPAHPVQTYESYPQVEQIGTAPVNAAPIDIAQIGEVDSTTSTVAVELQSLGRSESLTQTLIGHALPGLSSASQLEAVILGNFGAQTPSPPSELPTQVAVESDEFDDQLDEAPTQLFGGVLEEPARSIRAEASNEVLPSERRTLTPPSPFVEDPQPEEETLTASTDLGRLVTRPDDNVLILSPNAPVVVEMPRPEFESFFVPLEASLWSLGSGEDALDLSPSAPPIVENQHAEQESQQSESAKLAAPANLAEPVGPALVEEMPSPATNPVDEGPSTAVAAELRPRQTHARRIQPFYRPRSRPKAPIDEHISLIPDLSDADRRRPSDITELLNRGLSAAKPNEELYHSLKTLSQVELSPAAPAVALVKSIAAR